MHLKMIKVAEKILCAIDKQMDHLECVDTKELGEAIDIIKDIAETEYYLSVVASMDKAHIDEMHMTSAHEVLSLTDYLHSLTDKVNTMIQGATPEEKAMMKDKLRELY
jgi:hypothetical protein